jgi:tripartite-type tricarboxylate transporter receptor subunit TctC
MPMLRILAMIAATLLGVWVATAQTGEYPNRPIKIVVSVPAGGGVDSVTRLVAERMRQQLGQAVIIENKGGQSGNLGAEMVFAAEPDGYTLMASQPAPLTVNGLLYKKINYDPAQLEPVAVMTTIPNTLTVRPDFPAKTVQEFLAHAKANPGKLNYASQGNGTTSHLTAEMFQQATGSKLVHVPFRGTAPAINDLIAGHVDLMFTELASAIELHKAGKAKILAITAQERAAAMPDIPTMIEAGVPDFRSNTWNAISAPPKTPAVIVAKLNEAVNAALKNPEVQAHLQGLSLQPVGGTPRDMAELIKADTRRWADVIKAANVTIE